MARKGKKRMVLMAVLVAIAFFLAFSLAHISSIEKGAASSFIDEFLGKESVTGAEVVSTMEEAPPEVPGDDTPSIASEGIGVQGGGFGIQEEASSTSCGYVNADLTLTANVNNRSTCFTINASNVVLDCNGYTVNYGTGSGNASYGVNNTNGWDNITVRNCAIHKGSADGEDNIGIYLQDSQNSTITNITIRTNGTRENYGIFIASGVSHTTISNTTIFTNGSGIDNHGIWCQGGTSNNLSIINNTILPHALTSVSAIYFMDNCDNSLILGNTINVTDLRSVLNTGMFLQNVHNLTIRNNVIFTNSSSVHSFGIRLNGDSDGSIVAENIIITDVNKTSQGQGNGPRAIYINYNGVEKPANNVFLNNNLTVLTKHLDFPFEIHDDGTVGVLNTVIYNSSNGMINWTSDDLTTNVTLIVGDTIFLENNKVGLTDNPQALNLSHAARIEIRGQFYSSTPQLLKDGVRCDNNTALCNITYDSSAGILYANVSSFSNYTTQAAVNCSYLNSAMIMNQNVNSSGTCFTINASNIVLDCAGYTVNYGTGSGSNSYGVNNTGGWDNVTVKNCILKKGSVEGAYNYGIYFSGAANGTIRNNTIKTNGTGFNHGIDLTSSSLNNLIDNNSVSTDGTIGSNFGIVLSLSSNNSNITNNVVSTNGTTNNYGIYLATSSSNNLVYNNNVVTHGRTSGNVGIYIDSFNNNVSNNTFSTNGTSSNHGIALSILSSSSNNIFNTNTITIYGTSSNNYGMYFLTASNNNATNNIISTNGTSNNYGIYLLSSSNYNRFDNNNITARGTTTYNYGVILESGVGNNTLWNNNITAANWEEIRDNSGAANVLIYNNSFGMINWTLTNLTTNITLQLGSTIFIENNKVGLTDDAQALNLDGPARIEIRGLSYSSTPQLLKDGTRCDNTNACNISYSGGILYANVSSFSNYTSVGCGYINNNTILIADVNSVGTCFTINSSNVVLDCNGYIVTYSEAGGSYNHGINNSDGWDNVTVKNCMLKKGSASGSDSYGIYFSGAVNGTILNNTIKTNGTSNNAGIGLYSSTNHNNISNNTITTSGTSADNWGIIIYDSSTNNTLTSNTITTNGTSQNYGIYFTTSASSNRIDNNNIIAYGTSADNYGIYVFSSSINNTISRNTITTNGTSSNYGIYLLTSSNYNRFDNNNITARGTTTNNYGILLASGVGNNSFLNNTITAANWEEIKDNSGSSTSDFLIYNNSFGQINWTSTNLTANITLQLGSTIFIENNKVGLTDSAQALNLDGPARIEIRGLSYSTPQLLKDGTRCDNTNACNISYSGGILYANVSSFSNYTTQETPAPPSPSSSSSSGGGDNPSPAPAPSAPAAAPAAPPAPAPAAESQIEGLVAVIGPATVTSESAPAESATESAAVDAAAETTEAVQSAPVVQSQAVSVSFSNEGSSTLILKPSVQVQEAGGALIPKEKVAARLLQEFEGLSPEEQEEKVKELIYVLQIMEEEGVQFLLGRVANLLRKESAVGLIPNGKRISGKLLLPEIVNKDNIVLAPGESINKVLEIRSLGVKPKRLALRFTSPEGKFLEQEVVTTSQHLVGTATDYDAQKGTLDFYVIIPPFDVASSTESVYWVEYALNNPTLHDQERAIPNGTIPLSDSGITSITSAAVAPEARRVTFASDLLGPYVIRNNESLSLAQQFAVDDVFQGDYLLQTKVYRGLKVIAEHDFPITAGAVSSAEGGLLPLAGGAGLQSIAELATQYSQYWMPFMLLGVLVILVILVLSGYSAPVAISLPVVPVAERSPLSLSGLEAVETVEVAGASEVAEAEEVVKVRKEALPSLRPWGRKSADLSSGDLSSEFDLVQSSLKKLRVAEEPPLPFVPRRPFLLFPPTVNVREKVLEQQRQRIDQQISGYARPSKERQLSSEEVRLKKQLQDIEENIREPFQQKRMRVIPEIPTAPYHAPLWKGELQRLHTTVKDLAKGQPAVREINTTDPRLRRIEKLIFSLGEEEQVQVKKKNVQKKKRKKA